MHHIQDIILTAGSIIFVIALIPTIIGKDKPAISTSLLTGGVFLAFAGVYLSLMLLFSAGLTFVTASCWLILAVQKARQHH